MSDREWVIPSVTLTVLMACSGLVLMPEYSSVYGALTLFPLWILASIAVGGIYALPSLARMMRRGVQSPIREIGKAALENRRSVAFVAAGLALAGINMITFMWCKPLLNYYVPFRADPLLANVDYLLFLGHDPSSLLGWLNSMPTAIFYHRAWFALMVATLLMILTQRPSPQKSAVMVTYFILWSIVGPLLHVLLPAAGPVFYQHFGYGDRFANIRLPDEMAQMTRFLWSVYSHGKFAPGAGISAMPSLHIATTVWMVLAVRVLAQRWFAAMAAVGLLIFLLSMSFGWHYAIDGIVGGGAAILCYCAALRYFSRVANPAEATILVPAALAD